jgi:hypothetical protein
MTILDSLDTATTLDELLEAIERLDSKQTLVGIDMGDLPTFGGATPDDTAGIYSWDETRLLVGPGSARDPHQPWAIRERPTMDPVRLRAMINELDHMTCSPGMRELRADAARRLAIVENETQR